MKHITRYLLGSSAVQFFMTPEPEGGGGGQQQQGGGGQQQQQGNGGQQQQQGTSWTPPKDLPPEFLGRDANETFGKILPALAEARTRADGLRTQLAQMPKAPEKPEQYSFKPSEKLAPFFGDVANNPVLNHARAAAHKAGISDKAFGELIEGTYGPALEAGLISAPYDPKAELQSYMKHAGVDQATAAAQLKEAETFANGLVGQLNLPAGLANDAKAAFVALTDTAGGNALIRALQTRLADSGFRVPGESTGTQQGALTRADLQKMATDPRIDPANRNSTDPAKRFDPDLRKRYDEGYAALGAQKAG